MVDTGMNTRRPNVFIFAAQGNMCSNLLRKEILNYSQRRVQINPDFRPEA